MLRLVSELPAVFRQGGEAEETTVPSVTANLSQQCTERLKSLEGLAAKLGERCKPTRAGQMAPIQDQAALEKVSRWQDFFQAVPDKGLDISKVWAVARSYRAMEHEHGMEDSEAVQELALLAVWRRCVVVEKWICGNFRALSNADLAILRASLKAGVETLRVVLSVVAAPNNAEATAARAVATRQAAEDKCAAAAAATQSLVARPEARARARAEPQPVPPKAPAHRPAPPEPPSTTGEGIQRWLHHVRETASVAASGSDGDWRRQLEVLRAGLTGTSVCLGSDKDPRSRRHVHTSNECAICLELLPAEGVAPLPCGHTFHTACASGPETVLFQCLFVFCCFPFTFSERGPSTSSHLRSQWLQKCPRCPVCRHSPFMPLELKPTELSPLPWRSAALS